MHVDPDRPAVLNHTDQGTVTDRDGRIHSVFEQDRRVLLLSVPKSFNLNTDVAARELADVVEAAMQS
jgi:hypothetical protein